MKKRFLLVFVVLMFFCLTAEAITKEDLEPLMMNPGYYAEKNPDVKAAYSSEAQLKNHYQKYGIKEGRTANPAFDPVYYLNSNLDVKMVYGDNNYAGAYQHFLYHGASEGRRGSKYFDPVYYLNSNLDVKMVYGDKNYIGAYQHFLSNGLYEGRIGAEGIPASTYKKLREICASKPYASSGNSSGSSSSSGSGKAGRVVTKGSPLNMRSSADTSKNNVIAQIPNGASVTVLQQSGSWYKVSYGGKTGWCSAQYITITGNGGGSSGGNNSSGSRVNLSEALYKNSGARVTCGFDGYSDKSQRHEGIDMKYGNNAVPVYALVDGTVIASTAWNSTWKCSIVAVYNANYNKTIVYQHLSPSVSVGATIRRGDQIGTQNKIGTTSPHTHVEVCDGQNKTGKPNGNSILENPNPTSFWNSQGYNIK